MILRRFTHEDVDHLVALDSDPEVMRYLTGGEPTPRVAIERELLPRLIDEGARSTFGRWAAIERLTGDFVGWFALDPKADLELGYRLRRSAWGKGYATEGSLVLIEYAFASGARRVYAETMAVNASSRRVLEKVGMRHVRTFHPHFDHPIPGTEHGEVEYEILAP